MSKTLLVPLDGSNEAGAAFDYAVKNTSKDDTIVLFHGEPQVPFSLSPHFLLLFSPVEAVDDPLSSIPFLTSKDRSLSEVV